MPPMGEWEKMCSCNNPFNPDMLYIICEKCEKWYHPKHCGISDEEARKLNKFYCRSCNIGK